MLKIFSVLILIGCWNASWGWGMDSPPPNKGRNHVQFERILKDIEELSSPGFQGRQAGTNGGEESARFITKRFKVLGLNPIVPAIKQGEPAQWVQRTPFTATHLLPPAILELSPSHGRANDEMIPFDISRDFLPVLDSPSVNLMAPLVFVGYGIVDPAMDRNDYRGIDVTNRLVVFLRGTPPTYFPWVTHEQKVHIAKENGAAGYLTVTGPLLSRYEAQKGLGQTPLAIYAASPNDRPIPGAWINGQTFDQLLQPINKSLQSLQEKASTQKNGMNQTLPLVGHLKWNSQSQAGFLTNVLGVIPGVSPIHQDEVILIGAHRDHFGEQAGLKFPGADDNASGTAVMLEVARRLATDEKKPQRSVLVVSFDGEERGFLGSKHYVHNPAWPLEKTVAMINLDHVGVGNGTLTVGVTGLAKSITQQAAADVGLAEKIKLYGYFPGGDHVPFFEAGIPTITIVSAGIHPHFHQPSDTAATINPDVIKTATQFVLALITRLANPS